MDIVALLFIALFTASAAILAMLVFNRGKRRIEAEQEEQRRKAKEERKRLEDEEQQKEKEEKQRGLAHELQRAEDERKRIEEQTRRKAQEEEQRRKAEEQARQKAEKEQLERLKKERREDEEKRRKTEKERKRANEESQQKAKEAHILQQRPPQERGGRPRGSTEGREIEQTPDRKPRSLKPEIVCWNEGRNWVIGIEVPEELETLSVAQNEEPLEQDNTDELRYRLRHAEGAVRVTWTGGEKDIPLMEAGKNYLVFKMRKDWRGLGRLIKRPTTGYHLVIVPQEWERDKGLSGSPPVMPESTQVEGYKAHFFYQEQNGNKIIAFVAANGERIRLEGASPCFQFVGREIVDSSEDMGPLFGEQPPRMQTLDAQARSHVGVIVVGEEGSGRNKWRTQFVPQADAEEQNLPDELTNRRGGWYFVRIYDNDDNLLESMDFRFMIALKDIQTEKYPSLPGPNGHNSVTVQFLHQADSRVEPEDKHTDALEIRRENERTIVTVPPNPDCDKTIWRVRNGNAEIKVTLLVERIWWAFGVMGVTPNHWVDKPIILSREDFTATTDKALWVRFPRTRWVRNIQVDFNRAKPRSFPVEVEKKQIDIPLRDFCDTKEIENRQEESRMMIWVHPEGEKTDQMVFVKLPAEQPSPVERKQRQGQKTIRKEEEPFLLQATVKCRRGERRGKGFSRKELTRAEMTIEDVKHFRIPYDKRRKTWYSWNVETLKHLMRGDKHGDVGG